MADNPRIEELRRRVLLDPASIAFAALAEEYRRMGRYDEAIEVCRTGLQRHASYISAHVTLGRALMEVGRYDEAREELEYVLSAAPENLAAIRGLAEIHHRQGQSSDHPDQIASEMADVLAAPAVAPPPPAPKPIPVSTAPVKPPPPPPAVAPPEPERAIEPPAVQAVEAVETEAPPIATIEPKPAVVEAQDAAPVHEIRAPKPRAVEPPPVPAPPPAPMPAPAVVVSRPQPTDDPALRRLEAFLQAIVRARESASGIRAS